MSAEYRVDIKSKLGVLQYQLVNYLRLAYTKQVNAPGACQIVLPGDSAAAAYLGAIDASEIIVNPEAQIEIWRRDVEAGVTDWYCDFYGFHMGERWEDKAGDVEEFTSIGVGQLAQLSWNVIYDSAVLSGAAASSITNTPAETAMKTIAAAWNYNEVFYEDGRLTIETNQARGSNVSGNWQWQEVLEALQEIANRSGSSFDIVKTGAYSWEFRYYYPRGIDRSSTVKFSKALGNLAERRYEYDRTNDRTNALCVYEGNTTPRTYNSTQWEFSYGTAKYMFVNAGAVALGDDINQDRGRQELARRTAKAETSFRALQTSASRYGVHYCVGGDIGDWVTVSYHGDRVMEINAVHVSFAPGNNPREQIDIEFKGL